MIGLRMSVPDASIGEPEQDANSALTELDKGLRSTKLGEQCEAIVRFPRLFEKYPFPILINSSFLKLADVFRIGNNFLKVWVLRVCQQSEKHLDKILNVDEFLRRIFSVMHSNDPLARALTLRTLGAVAGIIPERQNVHHAIRRGLDSHDNVEVDAAIYATTQFAAHSNAFAVSMCNKLSDMVESENTDAERRDKLVRALRTVHGGAVRASGVLHLLHNLMERYPSASFVRASISAITAIAVDTVVHVPDQVEVLLNITTSDPRWSVRRASLLGLQSLAAHASLWREASLQALVERAKDHTNDTAHTHLCLDVMQVLVKCPALCVASSRPIHQFCCDAILNPRLETAAAAATVLTSILVNCSEEGVFMDSECDFDAMLAMESLVISAAQSDQSQSLKPLRTTLRCLVQICLAQPRHAAYRRRTATLLGTQLRRCSWYTTDVKVRKKMQCILEALAALGGSVYCPDSVKPAMPALSEKLTQFIDLANVKMETDSDPDLADNSIDTSLVLLCTVVMQERAGSSLEFTISSEWEEALIKACSRVSAWTRYRVLRAALRYGHTSLAVYFLKELINIAPSEVAQRWLTALHRAASADCKLEKDGISGLEEASAEWEIAGDASGLGSYGGLAGAWCVERSRALRALAAAATAANALCTQPPPAIHHAIHHSAGYARRGGGAAWWCLRAATRRLHNAHDAHDAGAAAASRRLNDAHDAGAASRRTNAAHATHAPQHAYTHFHADDSTHRHMDICHYTYSFLADFIESLIDPKAPSVTIPPLTEAYPGVPLDKVKTLEDKIMWKAVQEMQRVVPLCPIETTHLTHQQMRAIKLCVGAVSRRTVWPLAVWCPRANEPLCRLSVTPTSRTTEPAAALPLSHHLAVHIEGLIKTPPRLKKNQEERKVTGVQLTVTVTPHPRTNEKTVDLTNVQPISTAIQTVTPVRDFFSGQQLVTVPAAGLYTVGVQAACVDQQGNLWQSNHVTNTLIKAHEDSTAKGNTNTTRGRF